MRWRVEVEGAEVERLSRTGQGVILVPASMGSTNRTTFTSHPIPSPFGSTQTSIGTDKLDEGLFHLFQLVLLDDGRFKQRVEPPLESKIGDVRPQTWTIVARSPFRAQIERVGKSQSD